MRVNVELASSYMRLHIRSFNSDLIAHFSSGYSASISSMTRDDSADVAAD